MAVLFRHTKQLSVGWRTAERNQMTISNSNWVRFIEAYTECEAAAGNTKSSEESGLTETFDSVFPLCGRNSSREISYQTAEVMLVGVLDLDAYLSTSRSTIDNKQQRMGPLILGGIY